MFNFMKKSTMLAGETGYEDKDAEKERRKREKKERKEREKRERIAAGLEEPLRLEEVRRSLKLRGRRKEKEKLPSGITADYTGTLLAHLERDANYSNYPVIPTSGSNSNLSDENNHLSPGYPSTQVWNRKDAVLQSDSSETSLNSLNNPNNSNSPRQLPNLPPVPPRPPKRGILKGHRLSNTSSNSQENNVQTHDVVDFMNGQDHNVLARNTQQNEMITYSVHPSKSTSSSDDMNLLQNFTKKVIHSPVENQYKNYKNNANNPTITTHDVDEPKTNGNSYLGVTSTSPSADSLTDTTTNSSFATPPFSTSPVGESQGFHRWSRTSNFEDVYLPLPSLKPLPLPAPRVLTIQRQKSPRNDFGFSLRRAVIQERVFIGDLRELTGLNGHQENGLSNGDTKHNGGSLSRGLVSKLTYKAVILAEPGSYPGASETGLLPGDRLLEVNGVNVEGKNREEVIELIKGSHDSVTIKVQPIAELSELSRRRSADGGGDVELSDSNVRGGTLSRSGSRRFASAKAKSEEQLTHEKEWLQTGHMWLAHRGGFTAVVREGEAEPGRAKVRVLQTGEVITVDEDDLEKANPPQLDRCEDIASLRCLNECGSLHVLRSRFAAGLPNARAGHVVLVLGPPKRTSPIYTEKVATMFRNCRSDDMPPHVYAAAQTAHKCMLASRRDRAIVFMGRSSSGKTTAMRHCVWYLASAYPAQGSKLTPEKLDAALDVLHFFGSSRTATNPQATRFACLLSLDFDGGGSLAAASAQTLLPDLAPSRHCLAATHTLYHGCDGRLRRDLYFDQAPLNTPNPYFSMTDFADAPMQFNALKEALVKISVSEQEQLAIWKVVAAICHLGYAGTAKANTGSGMKYQFANSNCGNLAARLLGLSSEELSRTVFSNTVATSPQPSRTPSPSNEREYSGAEALEAFVTGLYNETFNIVAALVNRSLSTSARTSASILLLDTPGADNPMSSGQQGGAGINKLLSNYLQERLQAVFHDAMLVAPRERYAQEGITLDDGAEEDWWSETVSPCPMIELLDKAPQNSIVRSSQADLRDCDKRGLLWLLDEEAMYPGSNDDTFLERVMSQYGAPQQSQHLIKKAPHQRQFVLQHLQGTNPVLYDVTGWVKSSRENPVTKKALTVLQESQNEELSRLSRWSRGASGAGAWSTAIGDSSTLRRASSIRRTLTTGTAGMKRRSTALQSKFIADGIVETLRRCGAGGLQFVCCLQSGPDPDDVTLPLLRSQFRGFQLLDAARLYKQGFPEYMPLSEFARRYRLLATSESDSPGAQPATPQSDRQVVDDMLLALDLDVTSCRLGVTQIMFRGGVIGELDARRDAALARVLVRLQARSRGLLARRKAERLRTLHTAARCVQRNVRAFLAVRDWPWWRLLVRVTPLLAVHRTEHRLKQAQEELETLRSKLEKVENERTHYKNETERLESKLSEVGGELAEERAAAALATERADAEAAERLRVEKDNRDLVSNNQRLQQASERLELELLHWRSAENGNTEVSDSEGSEADSGITSDKYKKRYERAHRELQLLRAQLRRQHEDDLEQLVTVKKQLEKKVQDAYEEVEEQRAVAAQWKRKLQKLTNDMADLKSLLDEQTCRNNILEKRQRKFDSELHAAQEELKRERAAKERLSRERDQAHAEKYALEQSLSDARLEIEMKEERLASATRELEEKGGGGDEMTALRRVRGELERRVRDQEEELDELAGQIQLLESSKLRVEMLLEQQRKEARLEAAARDDELEETRANAAKKLKMLESQLESEHSERSLLLRERHELERRLASLEETARAENQEQTQLVHRLKRDLKRYRALLRDAQTMLEQKEKEGGGKAQIRQLKNQLEDLELAIRAANKAKQAAEAEASEATAALEEALRAKNEASERALAATREAAAAKAQLDDAEEEAAELLKKYRSSTTALCSAQATARDACARADQAADDAKLARDKLAEITARLQQAEAGRATSQTDAARRAELRNKELESSLELESTARARLEGQLSRLREAHEQLSSELGAARQREQQAADEVRKITRQLRDLKEENLNLNAKLSDASRARLAAESALSAAAADAAAARDDARLAARRAAALQQAIAGDLSSPHSRDTDSDNDSYSSDESIGTFLTNHKLSPAAPRPPLSLDTKSLSPDGRQSRSSVTSKQSTPTKESLA